MGIETIIGGIGAAAAAKSAFDPETGQTTETRQMDPAQLAMLREVYGAGRTLANQPFVPYTGARVAGFNPDQLRQFEATRGLFETGMQFDPLTGISNLATQTTPSLLETDLSAYQSPFTQQVIDTSLSDLDRARQMAVGRDQDRAISAGAFGGSRSGVLEAETNRAFAEQAARTAANLREQGFRQALGAAESDLARSMADRRFQAGLLGNVQAEQARRLGLLSGIGAQQQALQQRALDVPFQEFQRALAFGPQQLGLLSAAAGSPFFTGSSSQYQPSQLEGINAALGILNQPFVSNLFSSSNVSGSGGGRTFSNPMSGFLS
tara:strand:+ start:3839 stop:4801 length:963 start_codon:yes stop_codon:yes gene_type:complete